MGLRLCPPSLYLTSAFLVMSVLGASAGSCTPGEGPKVSSQTNWLRLCEIDADCGEFSCSCGACTLSCDDEVDCAELPGSTCSSDDDPGAVSLCGGVSAPSSLCLLPCGDEECPTGTACRAGICAPVDDSRVMVTIDPDEQFQSLVGFGSSLAYAENEIVAHPEAAALYDTLFVESGIDVIRLGNRFEIGLEEELEIPGQIIAAAEERMQDAPILLMTSGSPPPELKANGSRRCGGDAATCTLVEAEPGVFDYAGFAEHWRTSLEAYAAVGVSPDYVSIQNNPNWLPPESGSNDACRFLPQEGTTTVVVDGSEVEVTYPGYDEALAQVAVALDTLSNKPTLVGPEGSGLVATTLYSSSVRSGMLGAVACHLYGEDPRSSDSEPFTEVKELAESENLPVFQTEMQADGMDTALLIHRATTEANAAMYLQNDFIVSESSLEGNPHGLVQLTADGFETQGPYYAIAHYARRTAPGWLRVQADANTADVRLSAWQSPTGDALTIVLVNASSTASLIDLYLDDLRSRLTSSEVTLTVFDGQDQLAVQGELSASDTLSVPAGSVVTVALWE